jgi:CubicO group peptidase (beta-lactamase class C family)
VAVDDAIVFKRGYGLADVEHQVAITPETRFPIHWITMPFTATAILMLQEQGGLHVQDPICQYIPACSDFWREITIHHLLTHTSGISDWIRPWGSESERPSNSYELVESLTDRAPTFMPGEGFRYSRNGYLVLGHIIERVSGQSYQEFLAERVFAPLGMEDTGYGNEGISVGYTFSGQKAPVADLLYQYSASGLYSSVEDLYRWVDALEEELLISKDSLDLMFSGVAKTPSMHFPDTKYGYGWFVGEVVQRPAFLHGGSAPGFTSMLLHFPDDRVTLIVLRNRGADMYDGLEVDLAKMLFER